MRKLKLSLALVLLFNVNVCLAQEIVLYNSTKDTLLALYVQDSNIDVQPTDLLEGKTLSANAGVKLSLEGNLTTMDIGVIDVNGKITMWEKNDLSSLSRITITPNLSLEKE